MTDRIVAESRPLPGGDLDRLVRHYQTTSFSSLVDAEAERLHRELEIWQMQLTPLLSRDSTARDLHGLFRRVPGLSGVLYLSQNHVVSEGLFTDESPERAHPTDRTLHPKVRAGLPSAGALSFSFPRRYDFDGFHNSWGFIRIERTDDAGNGAGVLISATTIDPEVLSLLGRHRRTRVLALYNRAWDGAIHDFLHHIALYTNPSFGIGKHSPMSDLGLEAEIERWGEAMQSTFNYEYWAHRSHRAITEVSLTRADRHRMLQNALTYFREVREFCEVLESDLSTAQRVADYLARIYLWPLHVLLSPADPLFDGLEDALGALRIDPSIEPADVIEKALTEIRAISGTEDAPTAAGLLGAAEHLRGRPRSWASALRLTTELVVRRGYYEGWFHREPVLFGDGPVEPVAAGARIVSLVAEATSRAEKLQRPGTFRSAGITAASVVAPRSGGRTSTRSDPPRS